MTNLPFELGPQQCGIVSEEYLVAFGAASEAAKRGDMTFAVDEATKTTATAAVHAYAEQGFAQPGGAITQPLPAPDQEAYLKMYSLARLRIAEGHTNIVLPVEHPYQDIGLRQAVVDASREAGVDTLGMHARGKQAFWKRLLGIDS